MRLAASGCLAHRAVPSGAGQPLSWSQDGVEKHSLKMSSHSGGEGLRAAPQKIFRLLQTAVKTLDCTTFPPGNAVFPPGNAIFPPGNALGEGHWRGTVWLGRGCCLPCTSWSRQRLLEEKAWMPMMQAQRATRRIPGAQAPGWHIMAHHSSPKRPHLDKTIGCH